MTRWIGILSFAFLLPSAVPAQTPLSVPNGLPAWAFNIPDKLQPPSASVNGLVRVPGSSKVYEAAKIAGNAHPPDWFPEEHGPAPGIVTGKDGATTTACGSCHLMSGQGHPESADLAGLPAEYLVRQMNYFKSGARKDDARMGPIAKATSDEDIRRSAEYFAAQKPIAWVKVIETSQPPKTYVATGGRHRLYNLAAGTNTSHAAIGVVLRRRFGWHVDFAPGAPTVRFPPIDTTRLSVEFGAALSNLSADLAKLVADGQEVQCSPSMIEAAG